MLYNDTKSIPNVGNKLIGIIGITFIDNDMSTIILEISNNDTGAVRKEIKHTSYRENDKIGE